jgi:opine dehydrogenase
MNITIIGYGNLSHGLISWLGSKKSNSIFVLTSTQKKTPVVIESCDSNGNFMYKGVASKIESNPELVIPNRDMLIFTVPIFERESRVRKISKFVSKGTIIGFFPGVGDVEGLYYKYFLSSNVQVFSAQRSPLIARILCKNSKVEITLKDSMKVATFPPDKKMKNILSELFGMKTYNLNSILETSLSNSNPILHTSRVYTMFKGGKVYNHIPYFYKDWDNESSIILFEMDSEFMLIVNKLKLENIVSLQNYYQADTVDLMTKKISSIAAFKNIKTPMKKNGGTYILDVNSRYFTEDLLVGLAYIKKYALDLNIDTPCIDKVINWARSYSAK